MKVCPACGQENPDVAKFCLACGAPLEGPAPVASAEERKLVTVLFTDIVGSTAKAEQMDPEDVRARLAPYYTRLRAELERHGGTVEKFIGDAVVALFGAPTAHEDDPERAVRAALAIRDAIEDLNAEDEWLDLQVRIGVNTGEALVVVGAKASEGEGMASGDVMNTAARLQSAAPVNGILVGALTYEATRDAIEYRDAEPIAAKVGAGPGLGGARRGRGDGRGRRVRGRCARRTGAGGCSAGRGLRARRGGDGGASRADGRLPGRRGGTGARLPARPRAVPDRGARRRASVDLRLGTCLRRRPPAPRFEYTDEEYAHRLGGGHSSVAHAAAFARAAGVRRLAMFHHDPMRSDREIEELYDEVAAIVRDDQEPPLIAREGLEVTLAAA